MDNTVAVLFSTTSSPFSWLMGNITAGAAFGAALFIGREHAQAEYRWIEQFGGHIRSNMPWYGGFDPRVWNWASLFDWLMPLFVCLIFVLVVMFIKGFKITEEEMKYY